MKALLKKISGLSFSAKVIAVYALSLLLVVLLIGYQLIAVFVSMVRSESEDNLEILTEQVSANFSNQYAAVNSSIYSHIRAYSILDLMHSYMKTESGGLHSIRLALSQSVTSNTEYDYVLLQLRDGKTVDGHRSQSWVDEEKVASFAQELLQTRQQKQNILTEWVFDPDTGVYIVYDLYLTSPMRYCGRAIFHIRSDMLSMSHENGNMGFIFCDEASNIIACSGMEIDRNTQEELVTFALNNRHARDNGAYFISLVSEGARRTVGFMKKDLYEQARTNVIQVSIQYGLLGLAIGVVLMVVLFHTLNSKLRSINKAMEAVADGNFDYRAEVVGNDDISQIASTFNYMTNRIEELLEALIQKEIEKKDVEFQFLEFKYRALETQIRPHFIYNALETINSMAKLKGDTETIDIVQRIARYFRNITVSTTKQYILVQDEFDALKDYTEIYKFIHGDKLTVTFSARESARYALLPTMIVQPVVENALQHGLRGQDVVSEIIVHAYINNKKLTITVKDSGYGLTEQQVYDLNHGKVISKEHGGIGLSNVRERLALLYGEDASFSINNRPEGGAIVKVEIPLNYSETELEDGDDWEIDHI